MGKEFIVKGAKCMCQYGSTPGVFTVLDNTYFCLNGQKLTGTTMSLGNTFNPPGFGVCKVNPMFPKPCTPAIVKWSEPFIGLQTSSGGNPLTESSKATCATGGPDCITVVQTGQVAVPGAADYKKAVFQLLAELDPVGSPAALTEYQIPLATRATVQNVKTEYRIIGVQGEERRGVAGQEIKYWVTLYNVNVDPPLEVIRSIKWCMEVGGKKEQLQQRGDVITLKMRKEWVGKEFTVMPYLENPTIEVSFKTNIISCLIIYTSTKKEIFRLDGSSKDLYGIKSVKEIYDLGIQWFEPTADNYLPLVSVVGNILHFSELLHFSWDEIIKFAEEDRWMIDYRSGGSGDWKTSSEGANGYILVSIDEIPYWADAVGQIPFTIDYFTDRLEKTIDSNRSEKETIKTASEYGDGKLFGAEADSTNSYDNAMVLRTLNWAKHRYKIENEQTWYGGSKKTVYKTDYSPQKMSIAANGVEIK